MEYLTLIKKCFFFCFQFSVIYVCRNPKDCCVSYFHHYQLFEEGYKFKGNFADFAGLFLEGALEYGPYWDHLKVYYN